MKEFIYSDWAKILQNEFNENYFKKLSWHLATAEFLPDNQLIFRALNLTPYSTVKVVLLGQEPYSTPGVAEGLAFSSKIIAPSLKNILKELKSDLNVVRTNSDLTDWANQGILLLNRVLTVEEGKPLSHCNKGWENFTDKIVTTLQNKENIVWILLGKKAQEVIPLVTNASHLVISAAHPSPNSARHFKGCKIFSRTNEFLIKTGQKPINF